MTPVLLGDALEKLRSIDNESVDVIYLDPPFFSQKKHSLKSKELVTFTFDDTWLNSNEYDKFIFERLKECKRVLKKTGNIFLHCDNSASHHLRVILDMVFGEKNFRSEIIWHYKRWSNSKKSLLKSHQTIYFYSKTATYKFNRIFTDYSATTNLDQISQKRTKNSDNKSEYLRDKDGNVIYQSEKKGVPLPDVWEIPYLNPKAKERTGYPTQKPIHLLETILKISSDEGDTVLDPFCGSGTTLVAAKLMNRKYIGIDISEEAVNLTNKRLEDPIRSESSLLKNGIDSYKKIDTEKVDILNSFKAKIIYRNKGLDGLINISENNGMVGIKIQGKNENLIDSALLLEHSLNKLKLDHGILVKTHADTNLLVDVEIPTGIKIVSSPQLILDNIYE